jgi:hypothetical protein
VKAPNAPERSAENVQGGVESAVGSDNFNELRRVPPQELAALAEKCLGGEQVREMAVDVEGDAAGARPFQRRFEKSGRLWMLAKDVDIAIEQVQDNRRG